jgi:NAD(P)H-hydrate epimerase
MKPMEFSEMKLEALLPERPIRSNKATFGKLLCAAGSYCMSGAAYLAAKAAYRTGAGLVKVLTPEENRIIIQSSLPEALISVYDRGRLDERAVAEAVRWADVVAVGPGIGTSDTAVSLLSAVLRNSARPVVIDADGLNILAMKPRLWEMVPKGSVITPHPGEMSRLCDCSVAEILADLPAICQGFAKAKGVICVLKDHATAVSDGEDIYINSTGNSGMATGGSGDVLTGMIAALMAQGMPPFAAAAVGVRAHGMAGDAAAEALGEYSVMASDIIDAIPKVLKGKG